MKKRNSKRPLWIDSRSLHISYLACGQRLVLGDGPFVEYLRQVTSPGGVMTFDEFQAEFGIGWYSKPRKQQ